MLKGEYLEEGLGESSAPRSFIEPEGCTNFPLSLIEYLFLPKEQLNSDDVIFLITGLLSALKCSYRLRSLPFSPASAKTIIVGSLAMTMGEPGWFLPF